MPFDLHDYQEELVTRARQSFIDGYKSPCIVSPCGSGKSVIIAEIARKTTLKGNQVLFLVHRKELIDQIKNTFEFHGVDMRYVLFGMVQTIVRKVDKISKPKLIITDENHHSLAASYKKIYEYFSDVPRLGFTAIPVRLNGSGLGDVNDLLIEGVSVDWLIKNERLTPYKYYAPALIDKNVLKLNSMSEFSKGSIDKALEQKAIYGDVIKHYKKLADGEQAIVYCHSIESSIKTAGLFKEAGYQSAHIDGKTNKQERDDIIEKFRNHEVQILTNVDLIGEGFDVPDCSTVIMLRPTKSLSLFIQQAMRGMRYKPGKVSKIIDHVGNVNEHGLPDLPRKWSLATKKSNKKDDVEPIKECPNCFGIYPSEKGNICPYCQYEIPKEVRESELETIEHAELQELTLDLTAGKYANMEPEEAGNVSDLYKIAEARGYKKGWAYFQAKRLELL
ncbi:DEAD/DEAH box helicase [Enterococcus durans]|uniref:DEAD/DEAH box helicase n=1 Tax=Enterococcus durans TaxID=53345 RepID=UPI0035E14C6D